MRKNRFLVLILLVLTSAIVLPAYKDQEKIKNQEIQTNIPSFQTSVNPFDCDQLLTQTNSDDLSILANQQQSSEINNCLFLGCNGFF